MSLAGRMDLVFPARGKESLVDHREHRRSMPIAVRTRMQKERRILETVPDAAGG